VGYAHQLPATSYQSPATDSWKLVTGRAGQARDGRIPTVGWWAVPTVDCAHQLTRFR